MARIRTVKPEFWKHEDLSALPEPTHLLAAALLNYADDFGYFNANPALVKAECSPLREPSVSIPESLRRLQEVGYIELGGRQNGRRYGRIIKFEEHQRVSHPTKSKIADLSITWDSIGNPPEILRSPPETFGPEQGTGNREQGKDTPQKAANGFDLSGLPEDLTPAVWADFLKARKVNRKPISTQTAVDRVAASLHRCKQAGFSPDYALGEAIERGWQSVKLDWLQNTGKGQQPTTGPKLKLLVDQDA